MSDAPIFDGRVRRDAYSDTASVRTGRGDITITLNRVPGEGVEFAMVMWRPAGSPPDSLPTPFFVEPGHPLFSRIRAALAGETVPAAEAEAILDIAQTLPQPEIEQIPAAAPGPTYTVQAKGSVLG